MNNACADAINEEIGKIFRNPDNKSVDQVLDETVEHIEKKYGKGAIIYALRNFVVRLHRLESQTDNLRKIIAG